jgi:hypothetical protein
MRVLEDVINAPIDKINNFKFFLGVMEWLLHKVVSKEEKHLSTIYPQSGLPPAVTHNSMFLPKSRYCEKANIEFI